MAIVSNHLSASIRLTDAENAHLTSLQRIDPNLTGSRATALRNAFSSIRNTAMGNVFLTIATELAEEDDD